MNCSRLVSRRVVANVALTALVGVAAAALMPSSAQAEGQRRQCPHHLKNRSPEQTVREHFALIQAGNLELAMCDYAEDAVVIIAPQDPSATTAQVVTGLANIRAGLEGFASVFGNAIPQLESLTAASSVVLLTFHVNGPAVSVPHGSDTYVVKRGRIVTQTVHDIIEPTQP